MDGWTPAGLKGVRVMAVLPVVAGPCCCADTPGRGSRSGSLVEGVTGHMVLQR